MPGETSTCPQQDIPEGDNLIPFVQWICHILVKLKLNYYCSNSLFSLIISIINVNSCIKHPLHSLFPKTVNDLMLISNLKVFNECEIMAVCPNVKCNCIYKQSTLRNRVMGKLFQLLVARNFLVNPARQNLHILKHCHLGERSGLLIKNFHF